jgi:iron complex transport system permease protein
VPRNREFKIHVFLIFAIIISFLGGLSLGPADIDLWNLREWSESHWLILSEARLPRFVIAFMASALLGVSGLFMQSFFQNPLVGPYVLGVQNGAALSVALASLMGLNFLGAGGSIGLFIQASVGALLLLALLVSMAHFLRQKVLLLIVGLLLGQLCAGIVSLMAVWSNSEELKSFVIWGLGSFERVGLSMLPEFSLLAVFLLFMSVFLIRPLDLMLLGEEYAKSLGLELKNLKLAFLLLAGLMVALVTASCGPIAFLGLIAPHLARALYKTQKHVWLLPGTILTAGLLGILVQAFALLFRPHQLPINIALGLVSAPLMLLFLLSLRRRAHDL